MVHSYLMFYWVDEEKKLVTGACMICVGRNYKLLLES